MRPTSELTDQKYVKAIAHPLRLRILAALEHRTASPSALAEELDAPLGNVSYHVRQLHGLGFLKLVKETPRRGAVEHYYRLEARPHITGKAWADAPSIVRHAVMGGMLTKTSEQVNHAVDAGGFDRPDARLSRLPFTFDDQGFKDAARACAELVEQLKDIEDESCERLEHGQPEDKLPALLVLLLFEAREAARRSAPSKDGHHERAARREKAVTAD